MTKLSLESIRIEVDAEERDAVASWVSANSYAKVLEEARKQCPTGSHLMTLREYMALWLHTVQTGSSRACNEADIWLRTSFGIDIHSAESNFRHPFKSTVLVDTWLQDFTFTPGIGYEATVVEGGALKGRVAVPPTGKVYELNEFGLPTRTGGKKTSDSNPFEHRWWAFSTDAIRMSDGTLNSRAKLALFTNGGTIGCFCELIKAHYALEDAGGFYRVLSILDKMDN